jgi:hypothetical protein
LPAPQVIESDGQGGFPGLVVEVSEPHESFGEVLGSTIGCRCHDARKLGARGSYESVPQVLECERIFRG